MPFCGCTFCLCGWCRICRAPVLAFGLVAVITVPNLPTTTFAGYLAVCVLLPFWRLRSHTHAFLFVLLPLLRCIYRTVAVRLLCVLHLHTFLFYRLVPGYPVRLFPVPGSIRPHHRLPTPPHPVIGCSPTRTTFLPCLCTFACCSLCAFVCCCFCTVLRFLPFFCVALVRCLFALHYSSSRTPFQFVRFVRLMRFICVRYYRFD